MLRMIVLPLIVATIITAVSTVNPNVTGRIGIRTVVYYLSTLVLAAILGLILVLTIRPGLSGDHGAREENVQTGVKYRKLDSLLDMLRSVHLCYVFFVLFCFQVCKLFLDDQFSFDGLDGLSDECYSVSLN